LIGGVAFALDGLALRVEWRPRVVEGGVDRLHLLRNPRVEDLLVGGVAVAAGEYGGRSYCSAVAGLVMMIPRRISSRSSSWWRDRLGVVLDGVSVPAPSISVP